MFVAPACDFGIDLSGPCHSPDQCPIQQIPSQLLCHHPCNDAPAAPVLPRHRDYFEHLLLPFPNVRQCLRSSEMNTPGVQLWQPQAAMLNARRSVPEEHSVLEERASSDRSTNRAPPAPSGLLPNVAPAAGRGFAKEWQARAEDLHSTRSLSSAPP